MRRLEVGLLRARRRLRGRSLAAGARLIGRGGRLLGFTPAGQLLATPGLLLSSRLRTLRHGRRLIANDAAFPHKFLPRRPRWHTHIYIHEHHRPPSRSPLEGRLHRDHLQRRQNRRMSGHRSIDLGRARSSSLAPARAPGPAHGDRSRASSDPRCRTHGLGRGRPASAPIRRSQRRRPSGDRGASR